MSQRYDFVIVSLFSWGVFTIPEYEAAGLQHNEHYNAPMELDRRVEYNLLPLLQNLGRPEPDIISFGSLVWDVMRQRALFAQLL